MKLQVGYACGCTKVHTFDCRSSLDKSAVQEIRSNNGRINEPCHECLKIEKDQHAKRAVTELTPEQLQAFVREAITNRRYHQSLKARLKNS